MNFLQSYLTILIYLFCMWLFLELLSLLIIYIPYKVINSVLQLEHPIVDVCLVWTLIYYILTE